MPKGSHEAVEVDRLPTCDLCGDYENPAHYDAKTSHGPWGYLCEEHFQMYGVGLGLGKGQRLVVRTK